MRSWTCRAYEFIPLSLQSHILTRRVSEGDTRRRAVSGVAPQVSCGIAR